MQASIQKISKVSPIEGADKIEKLQVLGWELVSAKGQFKEGDFCVYVEIDSVVPDTKEFEFLRKYNFRVKTIKLRGQISQGLVLPMKIFSEGVFKIGDDVSEKLGITHYEKPISVGMKGKIKKSGLPFGIPVTDETRLQSIPSILEEIKGKEVYITTKCDGTSGTFAWKDGEYHVCSRNNSYYEEDGNVYWKISKKYNLEEKLKRLNINIAIRGEICGPGIQQNKLKLKDHELFVFDIFDIDKHRYHDYNLKFIVNQLNLQVVPLNSIDVFNYSLEELLECAKGNYLNTTNRREGIVIRPLKEMSSIANKGRMSFKVVNNEYLLKDEE